jgi:D-alanine-D-alanine ligase
VTAQALSVAVVAGGPSAEAEVSRTSAAAVAAALERRGHRVSRRELDAELAEHLRKAAIDVVFPVTHGPLGEDGCLQGLLEVLGLPYVGSGVLASALCMSKPHAKAFFANAGLPLARGETVRRSGDALRLARLVREDLGPAVVVKPASGGSAIGVGRIGARASDEELAAALELAFTVDELVLVECFKPGREVTCGVLEDDQGVPEALPPTLILPRAADWYDFRSRYAEAGSDHVCPAPFDAALTDRIQEVAEDAHRALGARDLSRVDFVVGEGDPEEAVTLLEVNTLPGMTATSLFPEAAAAAGIDFEALCDRLVRRALARPRREAPAALPMP